jgi:hypothetical protein
MFVVDLSIIALHPLYRGDEKKVKSEKEENEN